MIPVSGRYALPLLLLLLLALVPVVVHDYVGDHVDDCRDPGALYAATRIEGAANAREKTDEYRDQRFQFTVGRLATRRAVKSPFRYQIQRTFDPSSIYMQPTHYLARHFEADREVVEWLDVAGERLPITWQFGQDDGRSRVVGFIYVYQSRPVLSPFRTQLASVFDQLLHGTKPLTQFLAAGGAPPRRPERAQEPIRAWLVAAWTYYKNVCSE